MVKVFEQGGRVKRQDRPRRFWQFLIFIGALLNGCVYLEEPPAANLQASTQPPNGVNATTTGKVTVIDVTSDRGIGSAQISLPAQAQQEAPPEEITLRFHLDGLEMLRLVTPNLQLNASISSIEPTLVIQEMVAEMGASKSVRAAAQEALTEDSPYWVDVQVTSASVASAAGENNASGESAGTLIEVTIPSAFIAEAGEQITIEWIDFYR